MLHTSYSGIMPDNRLCCLHVNRGRHDVDILVSTRDSKTTCTCSWCGKVINNDQVKPAQMISRKDFTNLFNIGDIVVFNNKEYELNAWQELEPVE